MLLTHRDGAHMRLNKEKTFRNFFQYDCKLYFCLYDLIALKSDLLSTARRKLNLCNRSIKYM
jgi:hypothetical protein